MPFVRLEVRNLHGLGKTELHRNVDREDTKAILDGVTVSGLVGILRQLGDLTQFAAEIFHGIQEEVVITASRSNKLNLKLKQIEATVPSIQKNVLTQTNHIHFAYSKGLDWHPRIPDMQNHFIHDDLPQFIMAPYEDCRNPPRLHLLDKFDINGPGSCLKRYSDPTHFRRASKLLEIKKKKSMLRSPDISSLASMANQSDRKTFTSLSFSGRTSSSKIASTIETESKSGSQDHLSCSIDSRSGEEKPKVASSSSRFRPGSRTIASILAESESEDSNDSPPQDLAGRGSSSDSWHEKAEIVESATDEAPEIMQTGFVVDTELVSTLKEGTDIEYVVALVGSEDETESEGDNFVDALYTIDSESDNDQAFPNTEKVQKNISKEDNSDCKQETVMIGNNYSDDEAISAATSELHLSSPVKKSDELIHQDQRSASDISNDTHSYSNGFSNPLYDISGIQENQESEAEISLWTNGDLLGLKPSNPKLSTATIPENDEDVDAETFQEHLREVKSPFDWFTSSPPLDHMKISFNPSETLPSSELMLKLPDEYSYSSFQLVPETATTSLPDSDSDKDTFCKSSSYISDNSDNRSLSTSEQHWEEESSEIRNSELNLYDRTNAEASTFPAPTPQIETSNGNLSYLQNPAEPLPPPLPPLQWMVSKIPSGRFEEDSNQSLKDTLIRELEQNISLSTVKKEETNIITASNPIPENNVWIVQTQDYAKETETRDFLHQIRTKQFNLRHVVTTSNSSSEATMNSNINVILEKANSIRQAVASDDGDGESDSWSDSDSSAGY